LLADREMKVAAKVRQMVGALSASDMRPSATNEKAMTIGAST
jgi:hypothetical protein